MRRLLLAALTTCGALFFSAPVPAADASQAEAEQLLESAGERLLAAIDDVNETQWSFKAEGHRHTIGELAEHASLSTNDLLRVVQKALEEGAVPDAAQQTEGKVATLREIMLDQEDPPDKFKPREKLLTKQDVLEFFPQAQRKALAMVKAVQHADKCVYEHPSDRIGPLNGIQWFYYIALLTQSHAEQIEIMKKDPQYPKS